VTARAGVDGAGVVGRAVGVLVGAGVREGVGEALGEGVGETVSVTGGVVVEAVGSGPSLLHAASPRHRTTAKERTRMASPYGARLRLGALVVLLGTACASSPTPSSQPTPRPVPSPSATASSPLRPAAAPTPLWRVGASPLPLRPDGFGQVLTTPAELRDRRLPTRDLLPPPADGRFHARISAITPEVRRRMGATYAPGCPVPLSGLRYVTVVFRGFDRRAHTGELVVAASAASSVVRVFRRLFSLGFPVEEMRLPTTRDLTAPPTGDGNDTAAFVCRAARGQQRFSAHAYGLAIDVNPFQNPFVRGDLVLPELASAYVDRRWARPGMLLRGSAAVRAFTDEGWTWGGDFRRPKDYQHFSLTGD